MAEDKALLDEKLTEPSESRNAVLSSSERPGSHFGACENKQMMGGSIQPSRATANGLQAEAPREPPKRDDSYPSSLHSTSTCTTYSLEISVSTNESGKESQPLPLKTPPDSRDGHHKDPNPPCPLLPPHGGKKPDAPATNVCREVDPEMDKKVHQCLHNFASFQIVTAKSSNTASGLEKTVVSSPSDDRKVEAQPLSASHSTHNDKGPDSAPDSSNAWRASQEMEDTFYAFVIMHAEEDTNEAVRLRKKLESISSTTGATFSEDFEQPGCSTFRCVEDAIENSAYTMLLLTANFSTRLNDTNTDSVLMNSIEKVHKYNTVIPLIPQTNRLTRSDIPLVLRTKHPLDETKRRDIFEGHVRKVLDPRNISRQKSVWSHEQRLKKEREKKQMLQQEIRCQREALRESARVRELEEQRRQLQQQQEKQGFLPPFASQPNSYFNPVHFPRHEQPCGAAPPQWRGQMQPNYGMNMWQQPPSSIHIQNASCIMIGNNSTMTVGGGVDSGDEDCL